jgi:hypothetical protein
MVSKKKEPTAIDRVQQYSKEMLLIDVMIKDIRNTIVNASYLHFFTDYKENLNAIISDLEFKKLQLRAQVKANMDIVLTASNKKFIFINDHLSTKELVDGYVQLLEKTEDIKNADELSHVLFLTESSIEGKVVLPGEIYSIKDVADSILETLTPCLKPEDRLSRVLGKNSLIRVKLVEG